MSIPTYLEGLTPETIITLVRTFQNKSSTWMCADIFLRQFSG